jgi:hypothetical protein
MPSLSKNLSQKDLNYLAFQSFDFDDREAFFVTELLTEENMEVCGII